MSFVIFFHVTKMCVEALLSHQVVLLLIAMHAIVIFPALTSLIALAIFDCVFYSVFASIRRWISGERTNALQSLSFADRQRPKRSFYSRLDAGFRRWNSKVPSRRHRDRCYATDIEVGFWTTEISLHIGPTSEYSKKSRFYFKPYSSCNFWSQKKSKSMII